MKGENAIVFNQEGEELGLLDIVVLEGLENSDVCNQ